MAGTAGLGETAAQLRKRHESLWDSKVNYVDQEHSNLALRTYRVISWLTRAACEHYPGEVSRNDPDAVFIFVWIAFNAAYAADIETGSTQSGGERVQFKDYLKKLLKLDEDKAIYDALRNELSEPVYRLLGNKYLYEPFWRYATEKPGGEDWKKKFLQDKEKADLAFNEKNSNDVLEVLFDRLYVLRNQLFHGGAKRGSSLNRQVVPDGANILSYLVPIFVDLMLKKPWDTDWGKLVYPPLNRGQSALSEEP